MSGSWHLEGYFGGQTVMSRIALNHFPFQVGRQEGLGFTIHSGRVSRIHAEITENGGILTLTDNNSTNGTYVNHKPISGSVELRHGDILHFAETEVRIIKQDLVDRGRFKTDTAQTAIGLKAISSDLPTGIGELQELLDNRMVTAAFQPIIEANSESVHAYEILGRGSHPGLSKSPGPLFHIAESMPGLAEQLSRVFRQTGIETAAEIDEGARLFINIHPSEMKDYSSLLDQMANTRKTWPQLQLVLEIHEQAASNLDEMKMLREELEQLQIQLAYDDFGSGQARLKELIEAPAHYLKFDIGMVRGISQASGAQQDMVQMLVLLARKMGIATLAEGIEEEADVLKCREFGFDYIQGYYYGKPTEGRLEG